MLRLEVQSEDVWNLTLQAMATAHDLGAEHSLEIRCVAGGCGQLLGVAGMVPGFGPLFTSRWMVPVQSPITYKGATMSERRARHLLAQSNNVTITGAPLLEVPTGVIGLIGEGLDEYPDLLVRCAKHGDLVLDRAEVLRMVGDTAATMKVIPTKPVHDVHPVRTR
ncbi:MAG: hypothetical protein IPL07_13090 [Acidimicrobiaceae bacterium]|nr:hypothetical protein [Acidimicrobiaceae bacterium]